MPLGVYKFLNPSVIGEVRTDRVQLLDTELPLLAVKFDPGLSKDPELPNDYHTIEIDNDGAAGALQIILKIGEANAAKTALNVATVTVHGFSAAGTVPTDGTAANTNTVATLADLVVALNAIEGVEAFRQHGPDDYALNTNDFVDVAEVDLNNTFQNNLADFLFKDVSEINTTHIRVGVPEIRDSGRMRLFNISGTSTGVTNGLIRVFEDPEPQPFDGRTPARRQLLEFTLLAAQTSYLADDYLNAATYRGPLLVEFVSDDLSALDMLVQTTNAEY